MHPGFFETAGPFSLNHIAEQTQSTLGPDADGLQMINRVQTLNAASEGELSFFANRRYANDFLATKASACILSNRDLKGAPATLATLAAPNPYVSFARAMRLFYADALVSKAAIALPDVSAGLVHPTAQIDKGARIEMGAIVGREAKVGRNTTISAGAIIGYRTVLGDDCHVGAGTSVTHAIVGDHVILHAGVRIGQDGFGFAMSKTGHLKVPQVGCVIISDNVEIGANSTIDRGTLSDTLIGEGTKIDNLVQIGHNVVIGRHCVIVSQSGIAGSAELGDFVVMGAQSGILGHVKVGSGAQIAGMAHVKNDVGPNARMGGTPAKPFNEWAREVAAVRLLGRRGKQVH